MQAPNDIKNNTARVLTLVANRSALLMVQPSSQVTSLQVRARLASGTVLGPLTMKAPNALPATDGGRAAYSTLKYSLLVPKEWIQIGAKLELGQADFALPYSVPMTVTPGVDVRLYSVPVYVFGARAANSVIPDYAMGARSTGNYPIDQEYLQKLPFATIKQSAIGALTMDRLVLSARNDSERCYPAMPAATWDDYTLMKGDMNAVMLSLLGNIHGANANRDDHMPATYYGYVQTLAGGAQISASTGGGLGGIGSGTSVSGGDYNSDTIYAAIFNHEVGHSYGLSHADAAAASGDFPYPMGTKSGSAWGYDANKNQLLSTLQYTGVSCDNRVVNGLCYQRTPMSGGDIDRDLGTYRWTNFSDYEAAIIQDWATGKVVRDDAYDGGYKQWNKSTRAFEKIDDGLKAEIATNVLKLDQQVQTVWGTVSHFNLSPTANTLFVTPAYTGNLPRQFDPTVQSDLDLINTTQPGGYGGWYCLSNGCDYTLVASYADGTVQRILIAMGYHRWGSPASNAGINTDAQNVLSGDNLGRFAVNLPVGHGGLSKVQIFNTPFGSSQQAQLTAIASANLGNSSYPQVSAWTPADGNGGGGGGSGTTQFDASVCNSNAVIFHPSR